MHKHLTPNQLLAKEYLEELKFISIPTTNNVLTMSKSFVVNKKLTDILVSVSCEFPLVYPEFYIKDPSLYLEYPHIEESYNYDEACSVCLIKEEDKELHEANPSQLLHIMINKLEQFINSLNKKELKQEDIFDEFDSYWRKSPLIVHYNSSIINDKTKIKELNIYIQKNNQQLAIVDNEDSMEKFCNATNKPYIKRKILYINFNQNFPKKIPVNFSEFLDVIENAGYSTSFKKYKKSKLFSVILFSFKHPLTNERITAALYCTLTPFEMKNNITLVSKLLTRINSQEKLNGLVAKDISTTRVFTRGGSNFNMRVNEKEKKIVIVGCGSVGASLAFKLLKAGVTNLMLIDNQELSIDNIGRHLLGIEYINTNKAVALENFLLKQFLNIKIEAIKKDIRECFAAIKDADLIISALGDDAGYIEEKLIRGAIDGEFSPVISCWLEANAVAGHAILFDTKLKKEDSFLNIDKLFNSIMILDKEYAKSLKKDDVGCNSSYMPYTFLSADVHINHFAKMVISYILNPKIRPIWTSVGGLEEYQEHIKTNFSNSYTLIKQDISNEID